MAKMDRVLSELTTQESIDRVIDWLSSKRRSKPATVADLKGNADEA